MDEPRKITLPCHVTFDAETGEILAASCDIAEIVRVLGSEPTGQVDMAGLAVSVDADGQA